MDPATAALRSCGKTEKLNITALEKDNDVPMTTIWHQKRGRAPLRERAAMQQYLTLPEEAALIKFLFPKV